MKKIIIFLIMLLFPLFVFADNLEVSTHIVDTEVEIAGAIKVKELILVKGNAEWYIPVKVINGGEQ